MPPTQSHDISKKIVSFERILTSMKSQTELAINYSDLARFTRIYNKMQGIIDLNRILPKNKSQTNIRTTVRHFSPRESLSKLGEVDEGPSGVLAGGDRLTPNNFYDLNDNNILDFGHFIETVRAIGADIYGRFLK